MFNDRDSSCDYNPNTPKIYKVPFKVGEIIENKNNNDFLAKIEEIRISKNDMNFILNFERDSYNIENCKIVSEIEIREEWQKPAGIVIWEYIPTLSKKINTNLSLK